jgi:hypothetical protein
MTSIANNIQVECMAEITKNSTTWEEEEAMIVEDTRAITETAENQVKEDGKRRQNSEWDLPGEG